ncbi:MAG TPA: glycosyltransferase family 2 protein [Firmicutes bacterium]|nr:glycosyltransferase family 2 protein [Bacillota bacterium]
MNKYKIEVIIPVYNNEDTIERCLKSLKAQTFSSWRALIVDDASTDGSAAIVKNTPRRTTGLSISETRKISASLGRATRLCPCSTPNTRRFWTRTTSGKKICSRRCAATLKNTTPT